MTTLAPSPAGPVLATRSAAADDTADDTGGEGADGGDTVVDVWHVGASPRDRRRWPLALAVVAVLVVVGLLVAALVRDGDPSPDVLVVGDDGSVASVDPTSGLPSFTLPDAAVSADGTTLYQAVDVGGATEVRRVDPGTGDTVAASTVGDGLAIRAVSPDGGAVALMKPRRDTSGLYVPEPRTETTITVVWQDRPEPAVFDLVGNFEPETFTLAEDTLYLLEYDPPLDPERYFVRQLDLTTGAVRDVFSPQVELQPEMRGRARAQAIAPDSTVLYTLYTIPAGDDPVHDLTAPEGSDDARWAFVHVLSLEEDWSFCVFLPVPIGTVSEASVSLAISPDGHRLHVVDTATQTVAVVDTSSLVVTQSATVPTLPNHPEQAELAVGPDGSLFVASPYSVVALSPDLSTRTAAWMDDAYTEPITDIALSADGRELRIAVGDQVLVWDLVERRQIALLDAPGDGGVSFVGPPGQSLFEISVQCAC